MKRAELLKHFGVHTTLDEKGDELALRYHKTVVFIYKRDAGLIMLDSGGWRTSTTKKRINQAFDFFGLAGFRLYQDKGEWYISTPSGLVEYEDRMIISVGS